jgi:hypothetical protein
MPCSPQSRTAPNLEGSLFNRIVYWCGRIDSIMMDIPYAESYKITDRMYETLRDDKWVKFWLKRIYWRHGWRFIETVDDIWIVKRNGWD